MMKKLTLVAAVGVGYVLGSRAGREQYEFMRAQAQKVAGNPKVQAAAAKTQEAVVQQATVAAEAVKETVKDKVSSDSTPVEESLDASIEVPPTVVTVTPTVT